MCIKTCDLGRITAVKPKAIKVDSPDQVEVIVELSPSTRIWKGSDVSADALEVEDSVDVFCATPRGPEIYANRVFLQEAERPSSAR